MESEILPERDPVLGDHRIHIDGRHGVDVHVWCIRLRHDLGLVAWARSLLSPDERLRADAFRFQPLRDDFAVSRATLRVLLCRMVDVSPADIRFAYGPQGKPALAGDATPSVQFNVSHSGRILVCAFVRDRAVGVDVEQHRPMADYERIARRFFSPSECRDLMSIAESSRVTAFFDCWSRKEAYIKASGGGLSIPLDSFRVSLTPGQGAALLEVSGRPDEAHAWTIHAFVPAPGFSGAIAIRDRPTQMHIHRVTARDILVHAGAL